MLFNLSITLSAFFCVGSACQSPKREPSFTTGTCIYAMRFLYVLFGRLSRSGSCVSCGSVDTCGDSFYSSCISLRACRYFRDTYSEFLVSSKAAAYLQRDKVCEQLYLPSASVCACLG